MNIQDLLDTVCGEMSDNQTSQKLGITRSTFSSYRTGRKNPSDEILDKMIELRDLDPVEAYMAVYAEKIHNPIVSEAFRNNSHLAA